MVKKKDLYILSIIAVIGIFSVFTIHNSHSWGDDFALYILHAQNITSGADYEATGFIYNELAPTYSPQSYPPGFPLLLVPIESIFGLNFLAYKIYILCFFLLFLWLVYIWIKDKLANIYVFAIIFILGVSPFLWQLRESVLSDIPAAVATMCTVLVFEKFLKTKRWDHLLVTGLFIYFSYAIRTAGIVILPAVILFAVFNRFDKWQRVLLLIPLFCFFAWLQSIMFVQHNSYLNIVIEVYQQQSYAEIVTHVAEAIKNYFFAFSDLNIGSYHNIFVNSIAFYLGFILFVVGFTKQISKDMGFVEWLFLGNLGIVVFWPSYQGLRFFIPVLPFYLYYGMLTLQMLPDLKFQRLVFGILIICITSSFISFYSTADYKQSPYLMTGSESMDLFSFINSSTEKDATIMAAKPRAVCLMTGRNGVVFPDGAYENQFKRNLQQHQVDYVLINNYPGFPYYVSTTNAESTFHFKKVFSNYHWVLYQIVK